MLSEENEKAVLVMYHELDMSPNEIADDQYWPAPVLLDDVLQVVHTRVYADKQMNTMLAFAGQIKTITEWAEATGIDRTTIKTRLDRGWTVEEALTLPVKKLRRKAA